MNKRFLVLAVIASQSTGCSATKGNLKASISGTSVNWACSGPLELPSSPMIQLLEEVELKSADGRPTVQTEVRYEIQMNNQYQYEDNRHQRMPFLVQKESKPFSYDESTNAIYLYVPSEQRGQFTIKRTTIEYIPVQVGLADQQLQGPEALPVVSLRPGDSYTLRRPVPSGHHYFTYVDGVAQFFPGTTFMVPHDWTEKSFKIYVGKQAEKTAHVAYVVNVKQPQPHMLSLRKNDPEHTPRVPTIALAPGEALTIQTMVTQQPVGTNNDDSQVMGMLTDPQPMLSYVLDLDVYQNEKVKPKIEKEVVHRPMLGTDSEEVTTSWVLIIPAHLKRLGGTITVHQGLTHSGKDHKPQPASLPVFRVKIEKNKTN